MTSKTKVITNWKEFLYLMKKYDYSEAGNNWIFRGQSDCTWDLETSFERAADKWYDNIRDIVLFKDEARLIREFKRKAYHYMNPIPNSKNNIEWLSIMQHHGAPTRLLDCTYSLPIALYFAVENGIEKGDVKCAIFAINRKWLIKTAQKLCPSNIKNYIVDSSNKADKKISKEIFREKSKTFVAALNPYNLNQRLIIQQGVFLVPGNINKSFEENFEVNKKYEKVKNKFIKYGFCLTKKMRRLFIENLNRMNINRATLFPGLDGMATSLKIKFKMPKMN